MPLTGGKEALNVIYYKSYRRIFPLLTIAYTGISSQIRTELRDWAIWQARAGCYLQAALSSNDSKTLYVTNWSNSFPTRIEI